MIKLTDILLKEGKVSTKDLLNKILGGSSKPLVNKLGGKKKSVEIMMTLGNNAKIIQSIPKYEKFARDNFTFDKWSFTPNKDMKGGGNSYPAGQPIKSSYRVFDLSKILEDEFKELEDEFPIGISSGVHFLYIKGLDIASIIYNGLSK
jgi:hypothetical protein